MFFVFWGSSGCEANVARPQQHFFMLIIIGWSIFISGFCLWIVYSLLKHVLQKNQTNHYLFTENTYSVKTPCSVCERESESVENELPDSNEEIITPLTEKEVRVNEARKTTIDVEAPKK